MPRKPHRPNPSSFRLSGVDAEAKSGIHWDGVDPANLLVYEPTAKQEIPKKGSWVMITRKLPPIEGGIEADVRVGRIFYARHHEDADAQGFRPNGMYAVRITTPGRDAEQGRDLTILPYEYSTIGLADILSMWTAGEITFHPRNLDQARLNSIVFYARSRGIPLADSMVMALGTLDGDVGWFEPEETLAGGSGKNWKPRSPFPPTRRQNRNLQQQRQMAKLSVWPRGLQERIWNRSAFLHIA